MRAPEWDDTSVPRRRHTVSFQRARATLVLVDLVTGRYYTLEGSGDRVWDLCDGDHSVADIVSTLSAAHSVDEGMVRQDVVELFRRLSAEGLIDDVR